MKISKLQIAVGVAALSALAAQSAAAQNISLSINQPGVYGRVDIGEPVPQRAWVNQRPIIIAPPQVVYERQPIYLYVPPQHSNNWGRYCGRYNACAQPVVFVQDSWVRDRHAQYRGERGEREHDRRDFGHSRGRGHDRDGDGVRNSRDRDRDGDGVRNSRDYRPNDPYQR
jgi:hypothetical protein